MTETSAKPVRNREKPEQIAHVLRMEIIAGRWPEGASIGREPDLVERFGVSRPSLREGLRILEAEGLITVVRGVLGGVVIHRPNHRTLARTASLVFQALDVPLADVYSARTTIEPIAARMVAASRSRRQAVKELRALIARERDVIDEPEAFGASNAGFHHALVALAGNQTLTIMTEMLDEIIAKAVTAVSQTHVDDEEPVRVRERGIRSQERLVAMIELGQAEEAERHWRAHMTVVGRVMLAHRAATVVELMDYR